MCPTHDWNAKSQDRMETAGFYECLLGKAFLRDTHETFCFAKLLYLIHNFYTHIIYTPIIHRCWGVLLRENSSLRLKDCYTHNSLQNSLWIFLNSYLSISIPLRGWLPKHLPHHFRVSSEVLVLLGSIERSQALADAMRNIAGSGELNKIRLWETLLE